MLVSYGPLFAPSHILIQVSTAINARWLTCGTVAPTRLVRAACDNSICEIARVPPNYRLPSVSRQQIAPDSSYYTTQKFSDKSFSQRLYYTSHRRVQCPVCRLTRTASSAKICKAAIGTIAESGCRPFAGFSQRSRCCWRCRNPSVSTWSIGQ